MQLFLFSLVGGVIADRMDRRRLLILSQVIQLSCAFLLAFLIYEHVVRIWHILTLSFIVGTAQAFGGPAYQALVPSLVEPEDLPNAIALQSIQSLPTTADASSRPPVTASCSSFPRLWPQ